MPDHNFILARVAQVAGANRGTSLCGFSPVVTILARQLGAEFDCAIRFEPFFVLD